MSGSEVRRRGRERFRQKDGRPAPPPPRLFLQQPVNPETGGAASATDGRGLPRPPQTPPGSSARGPPPGRPARSVAVRVGARWAHGSGLSSSLGEEPGLQHLRSSLEAKRRCSAACTVPRACGSRRCGRRGGGEPQGSRTRRRNNGESSRPRRALRDQGRLPPRAPGPL